MNKLTWLIFLFLITVDYGAPNQRNLYFIERIGDNQSGLGTQHDCLPVNHWEDKKNIYEITLYCMSEWPSKWNIKENTVDQKFSFAQLRTLNVTSEQLYRWSAPLDIAEDYQSYLDQLSTSNEPSITTNWFYNCTRPTFGPKCQYSFDEDETSQQSMDKIVYDTYLRYGANEMNSSCYIHLECNLGSNLLCISWLSICDGIIQCIDGTDEEHCWQLEINECDEYEYRCLNGQCISSSFFNDDVNAPDCLDGSDERYADSRPIYPELVGPIYKPEGVLCVRYYQASTGSRWDRIYGCSVTYFSLINQPIDFTNKPNTTTDLCWLALNCYLELKNSSNHLNCTDMCHNETCKQIIKNDCPKMFFVPNMPIVFGHTYFAYTKEYIINQTKRPNLPEYICYNKQFCDGFLKNKTLVSFKNTTCRRPPDFQLHFDLMYSIDKLHFQVASIQRLLHQCNTVLRRDPTFVCDNSTMYRCMNSSKCIAQIRLLDNRQDCDHGDDEIWNLTGDGICPIKSPRMYFNCTSEHRCFSRKIVDDGSCQCGLESGEYSCEDENLAQYDSTTKQIYFQDTCDNITRLEPIVINEQEETDETECEQWPCNNVYTRCDGILHCWNGIDELDCHPSSLINCSRHSYVCFSSKTFDYMCLSNDKINDGEIDCVGGMDETEVCPKVRRLDIFFCSDKSSIKCISRDALCDNRTGCLNGEDERICHHIENPNIFGTHGICGVGNNDEFIQSDVEKFLCNHFRDYDGFKPLYFSLSRMKNTNKQITQRDVSIVQTSSTTNEIISEHSHYCYYHPRLRVCLNKDQDETRMTCLCPPSHYGSQCQYQNDRVSLTLQFRSFSDSWQTPFIVIISLIDDSDERIIHSHEQLTYLPVQNCKTKYNIDLLYSIRPKNQSQKSSIHIDIYEKVDLSYRGSLLIALSFPFMPVQRVSIQLNISHTSYGMTNCSHAKCVHGRCVLYFDDPKQSTFCQCEKGWSGRYCSIQHNCTCSSGSLCIGKLANGRSICVCPLHKWGFRCFLYDDVCRSNATCENDGQCIATDRYVTSEKRFVCICGKGYSGERCEIVQNKIIVSFEREMILPESMLIHFIEVKNNAAPENGSIFKMIPIDRSPVTIDWSRSFHVAFVEFIVPQNYYLIVVQEINNRSKPIETTLQSSNRCSNISEVFNESFVQLHLIRRIKYYHIPCQKQTNLSCLYDEIHFCLCTDFEGQRQANCFQFDHQLKRNCRGQSNCANDAQCLQDSVNCPQTSVCVCSPCFYGARCQFSSSGFGLSLDALIGDHIQPHVNIRYQPVIIQISVTLTVLISVMGLLNGILSMMTFINKKSRETGCGLYLIGSSITTLTISLVFSVKFWILLGAQMTYLTHQSFLVFQCRSIDFILRSGLFMDQWLNACVTIERAYTVIKGVNFDKVTSKKIAKFVIPVLLLLVIGTNLPEIIYRDLVEDESNDGKRIWCTVTYPATIQLYNLIMNIFHFCTPFVMNLLSAITIIIKTARLRRNARNEQNTREVLFAKFQEHKHLIITPLVLVILATPRLIISFVSGCMKSSGDAWLYLMGYFISFTPLVLTFLIFVVPSKTYKEQFYDTYRRYQRSIRTLSHRCQNTITPGIDT